MNIAKTLVKSFDNPEMNLGDAVAACADDETAVLAKVDIVPIGTIIIFSDPRARNAWERHVAPLTDRGEFVVNDSEGFPVLVSWGLR